MDVSDLYSALREYHRKRRVELLEQFLDEKVDVAKQRGRIRELDTSYQMLAELMKKTGEDDE